VNEPITRIEVEARQHLKASMIMAGNATVEFTDSNFDAEVLKSSQPVLVDFWAEWCMPCKMLTPTIDALASEYHGKAKIGKMDTDGNRQTALKYGINAIPTVILFKDGQPQRKFVGLTKKDEFKSAIDSLIESRKAAG
jgi:thioredoxin 1